MAYKYARFLNDLNDLKHIEWFVANSDMYEFKDQETKEIFERLKKNIVKKNVFYSMIEDDYGELVRRFDNDPYNYVYNISGDKGKEIRSGNYNSYFVSVQGEDGKMYNVPYAYIVGNPGLHDDEKVGKTFRENMLRCRNNALGNFNSVYQHYFEYMRDGGVEAALKRYAGIHNGKDYHLPSRCILFLIYNILLFIVLMETQALQVLLHFWQFWSDQPDSLYSVASVFSGHKILGTLALLAVIYFLVLDVVYAKGIWHCIFMKRKYSEIKKYHDNVLQYFTKFNADYEACKKGISELNLTPVRRRDSVYLPLIRMTNRRYNFMVQRIEITGKGKEKKTEKKMVLESMKVPGKLYYKHPVTSRTLWLFILLIYVHSLCSYAYMVVY